MTVVFDEICIDARDVSTLGAWWSEMLGWSHDVTSDGDMVLYAPPGAGPNWLFLPVPDGKVVKNRIHFDFRPDDQQAEVRVSGHAQNAFHVGGSNGNTRISVMLPSLI